MKVGVQLHAVLRDLLPGGRGEVDLPDGATVAKLLDHLGVDPDLRELVTVNGTQAVELDETVLADGDSVAVFPAVAGGARSPYLDEGIRLFNEGDYFLSHETLEEHWIEAPTAERDFYQGLIHLAVAFHHYKRGNTVGTKSQLIKARRRLEAYPEAYEGVDVGGLRAFIHEAMDRLQRGEKIEPPALEIL